MEYQSLEMKARACDLVVGIRDGKIYVFKNRDGETGEISVKELNCLISDNLEPAHVCECVGYTGK